MRIKTKEDRRRADQAPHPQAGAGHRGAAAAHRVPQRCPHLRAGRRRLSGTTIARRRRSSRPSRARSPKGAKGGNVAGAKAIGKAIAERLIEKGVKRVVFDRNGFLYHGRVKAVADAAREAGWSFRWQ